MKSGSASKQISIFSIESFGHGLIISAKKYLKMPAATESPAASKKEREELLWQALKDHIMLERQKKKEGENDE